jgi:hypothetical protein
MIVSSHLVPKSDEKSEAEHVQVEQVTVKEELTSVGSAQSDEPEVEEAEDLPESATTVDD